MPMNNITMPFPFSRCQQEDYYLFLGDIGVGTDGCT